MLNAVRQGLQKAWELGVTTALDQLSSAVSSVSSEMPRCQLPCLGVAQSSLNLQIQNQRNLKICLLDWLLECSWKNREALSRLRMGLATRHDCFQIRFGLRKLGGIQKGPITKYWGRSPQYFLISLPQNPPKIPQSWVPPSNWFYLPPTGLSQYWGRSPPYSLISLSMPLQAIHIICET